MLDGDNRGMMFGADPHYIGMDRFVMFYGIVEDRDDPLRLGRCRIRIFGIHPDDADEMPTEDLPWAYPIMPVIYSPAYASSGYAPVGPAAGTFVTGFFADGMDRQIPMITGTLTGGNGHFGIGDGSSNSVGDSNVPVDPNFANAPTNLNGSRTQKGIEATKLFMQIAKQTGKLDFFQDYHVAGIMGNVAVESGFRAVFNGNFKTEYDNPPKVGQRLRPYGGSSAYGYGQWIGDRCDNFISYCNNNSVDPRTPKANVGFIIWELLNTGSGKKIVNAVKKGGPQTAADKYMRGPWDLSDKTGAGMTGFWCGEYERPGADGPKSYGQRRGYTTAIINGMKNTNVPPRSTGH